MTIKESIISFLQNHPDGADDDELANVLGLSARQQANSRCRQLEKEGLVVRRLVNGKIRNFWADNAAISAASTLNLKILFPNMSTGSGKGMSSPK